MPDARLFRRPPKHLEYYRGVLRGEFDAGPAFEFPERMPLNAVAVPIEDVEQLQTSFNGWTADEVPGRLADRVAIIENGVPVSICFCARCPDRSPKQVWKRTRHFVAAATPDWPRPRGQRQSRRQVALPSIPRLGPMASPSPSPAS